MIRASVAMAVYNGEKYICEQLDSIIAMMSNDDELVISYDKSSDDTLNIIREYAAKDCRVRVVFDEGHSVESNFNNAVQNCKGKYIFLADQDDVWINDKINCMVNYFEKNPNCVVLLSDGFVTDDKLNAIGSMYTKFNTTVSPIRNWIKGTFLGCQMAFDSRIKDKVWPVSIDPPLAHDLWLGVWGAQYGSVDMIEEKLILHRLHLDNYSNTSKRSILGIIKDRLLFLKEMFAHYVADHNSKNL